MGYWIVTKSVLKVYALLLLTNFDWHLQLHMAKVCFRNCWSISCPLKTLIVIMNGHIIENGIIALDLFSTNNHLSALTSLEVSKYLSSFALCFSGQSNLVYHFHIRSYSHILIDVARHKQYKWNSVLVSNFAIFCIIYEVLSLSYTYFL